MSGLIQKRALDILFGDDPIIAAEPDLPLKDNVIFEVPSQSAGGRRYVVNLEELTCGCPFWRKRKVLCKHIAAARLFKSRQPGAKQRLEGGNKLNPFPNPPWYDEVKGREELTVRELLRCLRKQDLDSTTKHKGRPPANIGEIVVLVGLQAYNNKASRKAIPDPQFLLSSGLLANPAPCQRTLLRYMQSERLNTALHRAIALTADCIREVETGFAADSTFLKSPYLQTKTGTIEVDGVKKNVYETRHNPKQLQIMVGVETLVAVAAFTDMHDKLALIPLMQQFQDRFVIKNVFADAGYCVGENYEAIRRRGATAWIDFTESNGERIPMGLPHHDEMLDMYRRRRGKFEATYHKRSVVESANKIIKTTIKRRIRSKREMSSENESLAIVLVYNLARLLIARKEHGIDLPWADERALAILDGRVVRDVA